MSSKINILHILKDHVKTFVDTKHNICLNDYFVFFIVPLIVSVVSMYLKYSISIDATSTLVNFGSITTALLLSVLMLVYDQDQKNDKYKSEEEFFKRKKELYKQIYSNICYSVIISIFLVVICLCNILAQTTNFQVELEVTNSIITFLTIYLFTPIILFIGLNLMLTILMITKRIYTILTMQ